MLTKSVWAELAPKWPSSWVFYNVLCNIVKETGVICRLANSRDIKEIWKFKMTKTALWDFHQK
jgi:hypothetical protein